jgi:hypothetical protein
LPFSSSTTRTTRPFELIHYDLWTSPVLSTSGFKYFLVILDDFTHFIWIVPLCQKSDAYASLASFRAYTHTQFNLPLASIQCDNVREFDNAKLHSLAAEHGIHIRFLCPYTSQQNGKAEHVIRTVNDIVRPLLFQASLPPRFWVEALHHATHVLNCLLTKTISAPSRTSLFITRTPTIQLFVFLVVFATPTPLPLCLTNSRLGLVLVFFLVIHLIIRVIAAWTLPLSASLFLAMLFLTSPLFPLPRRNLPLLILTSFLMMFLLSSFLRLSHTTLWGRLRRHPPRRLRRHPSCRLHRACAISGARASHVQHLRHPYPSL